MSDVLGSGITLMRLMNVLTNLCQPLRLGPRTTVNNEPTQCGKLHSLIHVEENRGPVKIPWARAFAG